MPFVYPPVSISGVFVRVKELPTPFVNVYLDDNLFLWVAAIRRLQKTQLYLKP